MSNILLIRALVGLKGKEISAAFSGGAAKLSLLMGKIRRYKDEPSKAECIPSSIQPGRETPLEISCASLIGSVTNMPITWYQLHQSRWIASKPPIIFAEAKHS